MHTPVREFEMYQVYYHYIYVYQVPKYLVPGTRYIVPARYIFGAILTVAPDPNPNPNSNPNAMG